jgi:hypothetical protein
MKYELWERKGQGTMHIVEVGMVRNARITDEDGGDGDDDVVNGIRVRQGEMT